jgi:hypothetical protein
MFEFTMSAIGHKKIEKDPLEIQFNACHSNAIFMSLW